ncbi:MAG: hypothetical protein H7125_06040 [Proteobacteria bacterium]|nr:hypothetical protein [Burkholderiales bacterium]
MNVSCKLFDLGRTAVSAAVFAGAVSLSMAPLQAQAQGRVLAPTFSVLAGGQLAPLVFEVAPQLDGTYRWLGELNTQTYTMRVSGSSQPDPFILWSVAVTNTSAGPLGFGFMFSQPVIDGPYNRVTNGFSGSVTDLAGDGASVTNVLNSVSLVPGGLVPGSVMGGNCAYPGPNTPTFSGPCPAGGGQFGPAINAVANLNYTSFSTDLTFTLSSFDSASFNGAVVLDATVIPLPASLPLFAFGLVAGFAAWRKRLS